MWQLGWISFFADVSSELVYPLIPGFITGILGAPKTVLGLIEGIAEGLVSLIKGYSGIHSDRLGRRVPYIRLGYGLSGVAKPLLALAFAWPIALLSRALDRFGKGARTTARDALIADVVSPNQRGAAFGWHRSMDTAGALVGVLLAALLVAWLGQRLNLRGYQVIFLLAGIPGIVAWGITLHLKEAPQAPVSAASKVPIKRLIQAMPKSFWLSCLPFILFGIANSSDGFILLRAQELGYSPLATILAYALYNVAYMLVSYPAGKLSDRFGRWPLLILGWGLYALVYTWFAFVSQAWLPAALLFYGLCIGITKAVGTALIVDHSPADLRASAMGLFNLFAGAATLLGNLISGMIWDKLGSQATFLTSAGLALLSTILALSLRKQFI